MTKENAHSVDLFIIGSGPGGYVAAVRAAQLGLTVAIADKRGLHGGTCLNVGCIPSKALLHSTHLYWQTKHHVAGYGIEIDSVNCNLDTMMNRKNKVVDELTKGIAYLFKKNKVTALEGTASFQSDGHMKVELNDGTTQVWTTKNVLIATGSQPSELAHIPFDGEHVISSTHALSLTSVPNHLVVVGGGYIGLELGSVWARLGAKVTVVEAQDRIAATMDADLSAVLQKALQEEGMEFKLAHKLQSVAIDSTNAQAPVAVNLTDANNEPIGLECDKILFSIGRKPYTQDLGLENISLTTTDRGFLEVDESFQTSIPGVYAIGDVISKGPMLAHKAMDEAIVCVERIAGQKPTMNYNVIPAVIYTMPEVASVGLSEQDLKAQGRSYKIGKFPFSINSRSKAVGNTVGFVKILADEATDTLLGVHIIGEMAGTMIAQAATAMEFGASSEDIARICHAHPTHSETLKEAAWATFASALHS